MKMIFLLSLFFISTFSYPFPGSSAREKNTNSLIEKRQNKAIENRGENVGAAAQFEKERKDIQKQQGSQDIPSLRFQADDPKKTRE
jgi:hypothetical protein